MRSPDSATTTALNAYASGIVERDAVTFWAKDRTTSAVTQFAYWMGQDTVSADVRDGDLGTTVSRTFVGEGGAIYGAALVSVDDVPNVGDLTVRHLNIVLSQTHPTVQTMIRGYDIRLVRVEIHRLLFDPATRVIVGTPDCHFIGQVGTAPINTPQAGTQGSIVVEVVSDSQETTRINPAKMSDQTLRLRTTGDAALQYVSVLASGVDLPWGEVTIR